MRLQLEETSNLAREFEALLTTHSLLDARTASQIADDASESISSVLSSWYHDGFKGIRDTASVVYTGLGEGAGEVRKEVGEKGVWGGLVGIGGRVGQGLGMWEGKGKGKEVVGSKGSQEGWKDVDLKASPKWVTRRADSLSRSLADCPISHSLSKQPSTMQTAVTPQSAILHAEEAV